MSSWSPWQHDDNVLLRECGDWYVQIDWSPTHGQAIVWVGHGRAGATGGFRTNRHAIREASLARVKRLAMDYYREVRERILTIPEVPNA